MEAINFGEPIIEMIKLMYADSSAVVVMNDIVEFLTEQEEE